ncbi:MAG: response regulator [Deltaproteobacteria bacterium]|nr:response regulator [Deltaproteobacteria bacterium]
MIVLVVDDSAVTRSLIRRTINLSGLPVDEILEASDGAEAIQVLASRGADILITDINMPGMSGVDLVRAVRGDPQLRSIPVLVVSTDGSHARRQVMEGLGVTGYLSKPFRPEDLRAQLAGVVRGAA